jgi:tetratricopeptide (TPR) repeat protein
MLHRNLMARIAGACAAASIAIMAASSAHAAPADDLRDAQKLYGQGKLQPALEKDEAYLREQPRDPQGRFLKGLILTEQKKTQEAIQVFTGLTEDFPELPEPYNNLAVLYASQGNYEKAKSALELAIHTHPTYATAHENLGDIYAELASRAYDRALQLDKNNTTAQVKLAMVKDLFSAQKVASRAQAVKEMPSAKAEAPKAESAAPAPKAESAKPEVRTPPRAESAKAEPAKQVAKAEPPKQVAKAEPAAQSSGSRDAKAEVESAIADWARAWSAKDVKGYLAHYAPDFEIPGGESRAAWEKQREERISRPKSIDVEAKVLSAKVSGNEATVRIRQSYKSDTLKSHTTKTITLEKAGDRWLIKQERSGG